MKNSNFHEEQKIKILKGLELAYQKLILFKKSKQTDFVFSQDGKIVKVSPNKLT